MNINYKFNPDRTKLILFVGPREMRALEQMKEEDQDEFYSHRAEIDVLDRLIANSELDWVSPSETGDLTDAPMLGIRGEDGMVIERWAYMKYETRSFLDDLIYGGAVFVS